ncbi:Filamentous haemagglutinin, N-terminal [Methylophilaceae bacterium]
MMQLLTSHANKGLVFFISVLCLCVSFTVSAETAPDVNALPTNGQVVAGTANISTDNSNANAPVLNVNQASQRAVVNWDKFDVGSAATVNFKQPNAQASTLNRVTDANPSKVFGKINAPGEVVLVNQAGVYFAPGASLDVGSVVATSHSISDADYMAGKNQFDRNGATGKVINEGNIKTALAGYVALLAPEVRNSGVIVAQMGTDSVTLTGALARATGSNVGTTYAINQGSLTTSAGSNYSIQYTLADFAITARPVYVTANAGQSKIYGETDPTFTYTTAANTTGSGLMGTDSVTLTGALARATGSNVGTTYAINQGSLTTSVGSNYSIQYTSADFAITARPVYVTANAGQSKIYGETDPTFTYTTAANTTGSGLMGTDSVTLTGALARATGSNVGTTYAINQGSLTTSAGSNYSIQYTGANFAITAKPVVISSSNSATTYNGVSTYEDFANAAGFSTDVALVGSDAIGSFTQAVTVGGVAVTGIAQAGSFVATPSAAIMASGSASNYAFTYSATTNTVAKANLSISATASLTGNVYNGSAYTGNYTSTFLGADASLAAISGLATGTNVGSYASNIAVTGAVLDNYNAPTISNANFAISPRPISMTPTVATKVIGDADPALEVTIRAGSMAPTDALNDVTGAISRTAGEEVASYDILMGVGAKAANYDISYSASNGAFSITDRPVVSTGSGIAGAILVIEDEELTRREGRRDRRRSVAGRCFP